MKLDNIQKEIWRNAAVNDWEIVMYRYISSELRMEIRNQFSRNFGDYSLLFEREIKT